MARALLATLVAAAGTAAVLAGVLAGCDGGDPSTEPTPAPTTTPLAQVATGTVAVARDGFCDRVAPAAVESALGAAPTSSDTWSNGERARLAPGVTDVAHEYGCEWAAAGTTARAWVFAPPVTAGWAEDLRRAATRTGGCAPVPGAPRFGSRDVTLRCSTDDGAVTAFHGLFGDAWLSCSLQTAGTADDSLDRAAQWCATVLQAAAA